MVKETYLTMSRLGNKGRLANQIFQICSVIGLAKLHNKIPVFPEWGYLKYFQGNLNPIPDGVKFETVKEKCFNHYEWDFDENKNYDLDGYLQTDKYFLNCEKEIRELLTFKPEIIQSAKKGIEQAFEKQTISIHIRRTDYVMHPLYFQLPITWFIKALLSIENWQDHNIILFSDDPAYCRVHFEALPNVFFSEGRTPIEDVCLMSLCDNHILSNSSISWWGAYLSKQKNVIHPKELFRGDFSAKDIKDYWPDNWKCFWPDNFKLDLTDCTFTLPVMYDHEDRKKNLDLCVCILQTNFDTNIIIGEQGGSKFEYMSQWAKYMKFDLANFHRTKMLNDMAIAANTPYIANWDCDVIVPPMQVYLAVMKLREGKDMVFPYDGRFARLPRQTWFKPIEKLLDIGAIGDTEPKGKRGRPVPESSVGGAVFFNKDSFIDGGMENEFMISFGPEDCERNDRFTTLGFKKDRVGVDANGLCGKGLGGCLYHIDHFCGPDSSTQNSFFKANHVEYNKVHVMSKEELRLYIDTWPWRHRYTESYYKRIEEGAVRSAKEIYAALEKIIKFETIIDVGCGVGEFRYKNYTGVDFGSPMKENYIDCDLEKDIVTGRYDLCLCLEVAEHLSEGRADVLIEMLCNLSEKVLFSAAVKGQGGTGHCNEQPASYWAAKFENNGFYPHKTDLRKILFHNNDVETWYKNNIILYSKVKFKINYEIDFIHPQMFESCIQHYKNQLMQLQEV